LAFVVGLFAGSVVSERVLDRAAVAQRRQRREPPLIG
jgi:hypothetical protein